MVTQPPPAIPGTPQQPYAASPYSAPIPFAAPVIPYATPASMTPAHLPAEAAWQDGPVLVVRKGVILPPLCVRCGDVAEGSFLKRSLSWHHPALYLLILFPGLLIYIIVASCVQERGSVALHLCATHRRRRLTLIWTAWSVFFAGAAAIFDGAVSQVGWVAIAGLGLIVASLIVGTRVSPLSARKIDNHFMWLNGAGLNFLRALPSLPRRW